MRSISGLAEAASLFIGFVVAVEGFVAPCAYQHQAPLQYRRHQHEHLVVTPGSRLASFCGSSSRTASTHPLRMNKTGGGSQDPPSRGIDSEGIDAKGGPDTAGIYGFAREIIEKEEAQAPFRRLRLISYAVPAFIAIFLAGISLAGMAGLDEFKEVSENLPNPLVDAGVIGVAFYLWVEEVKTKRSSLALLKKQYEENSKVANRSARRRKKVFGKKKKALAMNAAAATKEQPAPPAEDTPAPAAAQAAAPKKGMFDGVKETLDAVNKQSYYQALALNKELEEKGVLPPLERQPTPPGGDQGGVVAPEDNTQEPELATATSGPAVAAGVPDGRKTAAVSQDSGSKRPRKKGKGGKKGKRGK